MDMYNNPFFRYRPSVRKQPAAPAKMSPSPKVVQIPVHFIGSEKVSRSASALKIQKIFRGFLVRRSVKRIIAIKRDVDEIERRISRLETLELIRRDEKERLRLNETLMSLLFKLDSINGVDDGVRVCRKAVIKKAIALQERIDSVVVSAVDDQNLEITGSVVENSAEFESGNQIGEYASAGFDNGPQLSSEGEKVAEKSELLDDFPESENLVADDCEITEFGGDLEGNAEEVAGGNSENREFGGDLECLPDLEKAVTENLEMVEIRGDLEGNAEEINGGNSEIDSEMKMGGVLEGDLRTRVQEEEEERCEEKEIGCVEESMMMMEEERRDDDKKRDGEIMEKMVEDNEKMMNMMSKLCEKNEMQTRMLNALAQRVEQLEKAFVCQQQKRLRKKNKSKHSA